MFISDGTKSELRWQLSGVRPELGNREGEGERKRERRGERGGGVKRKVTRPVENDGKKRI